MHRYTVPVKVQRSSRNRVKIRHPLQALLFDPNPLASNILNNKTITPQKLRIPTTPETHLFSQRNDLGTGNANRHIKANPVL